MQAQQPGSVLVLVLVSRWLCGLGFWVFSFVSVGLVSVDVEIPRSGCKAWDMRHQVHTSRAVIYMNRAGYL